MDPLTTRQPTDQPVQVDKDHLLSMQVRVRRWLYAQHLWISMTLGVIGAVAAAVLLTGPAMWKEIAVALGAVVSLLHLSQQHQREETKLFKDLFVSFNAKFDEINGKLAAIIRPELSGHLLTDEEAHTLGDYFNLCAEEYLFYLKGYIDPDVWESWVAGMHYYFNQPRIAGYWYQQGDKNSYYKFSPERIGINIPGIGDRESQDDGIEEPAFST
jgi:hypothetical protein